MPQTHTHQHNQTPSDQHQSPDTTHPPRNSLKIATGVGISLLTIIFLLAVTNAGPFAEAQQSNTSKSSPPEFKSKYTAKQITSAKQHKSYSTFYNAQLIVVGQITKEQAPVPSLPGAEKLPTHFQWTLRPTQFLYINQPFSKKYPSYHLNGHVPDADLNKTPYLLVQTFGQQQTYLAPATKEILQCATIAIEQRKHADATRLHLAKTNPSNTPLFKAIRSGKNVATVDVIDERAASTSIDRAGHVQQPGERIDEQTHIVLLSANLRGKLPQDAKIGTHLRINKPLPRPVTSQPLLIVWEEIKGRAQATHLATMDEATRRIAAAALKRNYQQLTITANGPSHGSSRGSNGPQAGHNHHDHDHDIEGQEDTPIADTPHHEQPHTNVAPALDINPQILKAALSNTGFPYKLNNAKPNRQAFEDCKKQFPLKLNNTEDLKKYFSKAQANTINKQIDMNKATLLVFAWHGSGQDQLYYNILKSNPPIYVFHRTRGKTRDLRPHTYVYVVGPKTKWSAVK